MTACVDANQGFWVEEWVTFTRDQEETGAPQTLQKCAWGLRRSCPQGKRGGASEGMVASANGDVGIFVYSSILVDVPDTGSSVSGSDLRSLLSSNHPERPASLSR
jgi:hypothetical protein